MQRMIKIIFLIIPFGFIPLLILWLYNARKNKEYRGIDGLLKWLKS